MYDANAQKTNRAQSRGQGGDIHALQNSVHRIVHLAREPGHVFGCSIHGRVSGEVAVGEMLIAKEFID